MPNIDIPLPADLTKAFQLPTCKEISLPVVKPMKITLPTGGTLSGLSDLSRGIPTDCSVTFSLMLQIAPFLASTECLFKVLGLIGPLMDVISVLTSPPPDPIKLGKAVPKLVKAFEALAPCIAVVTGLGIIPFLKDLICFILKALNCFLGQMKSLLGILNGLTLRLNDAISSGNTELADTLQCAQNDALAQGGQLTNAIEPISVIIGMVGTLAGFAGQEIKVDFPSPGGTVNVDSLNAIVQAVQAAVGALTVISEGLGGCDA
jgi:hypothetical protein